MTSLVMRLRYLLRGLVNQRRRRPVSAQNRTAKSLGEAWQQASIPQKQWELVERQLAMLDDGKMSPEFEVFVRSIEAASSLNPELVTVLEIGCSSGYYGDVLRRYFPHVTYTGVDYSQAFVDFGRAKFPGFDLRRGDTTALKMENREFDVVVSGSVLLHVLDWRQGVRESCRVARQVMVLHRTPVSTAVTTLFTKTAYGQKMVEWTFNEMELIESVHAEGFTLHSQWPVYEGSTLGSDPTLPNQFTYVFTRN